MIWNHIIWNHNGFDSLSLKNYSEWSLSLCLILWTSRLYCELFPAQNWRRNVQDDDIRGVWFSQHCTLRWTSWGHVRCVYHFTKIKMIKYNLTNRARAPHERWSTIDQSFSKSYILMYYIFTTSSAVKEKIVSWFWGMYNSNSVPRWGQHLSH